MNDPKQKAEQDLEEILKELKKGSFDDNPRLCRRVICSKCGKSGKKFVDFLKDGKYEVGKTENITVAEPGQYALFQYGQEVATSLLIKVICENCGNEEVLTDPILTIEYLRGICRNRKPRITYA